MSNTNSNSSNVAAVPDEAQQVLLVDSSDVQSKLGPVAKFPSVLERKAEQFAIEDLNDYKTANVNNEFIGLTKEELKEYINSDKWKRIRWIIAILYLAVIVLLIIGSVFLVLYSPRCPPKPKRDWYQREIIYEVDVPMFRDADGDGVGDIKGLTEQLPYLETNRMKSILIQSSIFNFTIGTSTKLDGTSSIGKKIDLFQTDPIVGKEVDLQDLVKTLYRKDMHLIIDLPLSSSFDSNGFSWYGSSKPLTEQIKNPCQNNVRSLGCRYYRQYGRLPLNFNQTEIGEQAKLCLTHWLITKKLDGVRVDLPLEIGQSTGEYQISYKTISDWLALKTEIEKKSKPKLLLLDIPSGLLDLIDRDILQNNTAHPLYLSQVANSLPINARQLNDRFDFVKLSKPQFWKLGSKRSSDDLGILKEEQLAKEMILATSMLIGGTPTFLYGDELGLDQKSYPFMPWTSDKPTGGFSSCQPTDCGKLLQNFPQNPMKINVKRQEALGGQSTESLLKISRRLAILREQNSFLFGSLQTGYNEESNLFWFIREAPGHPGYVVLFNLHASEAAHISLHDLTEKRVPVHVHYEYQWPKVNFPTSNSNYIHSDNLIVDPRSINIFWWKAKLIESKPFFGKAKDKHTK